MPEWERWSVFIPSALIKWLISRLIAYSAHTNFSQGQHKVIVENSKQNWWMLTGCSLSITVCTCCSTFMAWHLQSCCGCLRVSHVFTSIYRSSWSRPKDTCIVTSLMTDFYDQGMPEKDSHLCVSACKSAVHWKLSKPLAYLYLKLNVHILIYLILKFELGDFVKNKIKRNSCFFLFVFFVWLSGTITILIVFYSQSIWQGTLVFQKWEIYCRKCLEQGCPKCGLRAKRGPRTKIWWPSGFGWIGTHCRIWYFLLWI